MGFNIVDINNVTKPVTVEPATSGDMRARSEAESITELKNGHY